MSESRKINILFCYEEKCGGETIAMQSILSALESKKNFVYSAHIHTALKKTSFISFYSWIAKSVWYFYTVFVNQENKFIIYTSTYSASVAAILFILSGKAKVIFHYHGSRLPAQPSIKNGLSFFTQLIKYISVFCLQNISFICSERIIVPSIKSAQEINTQFFHIPMNQIAIIPNGYDKTKFFPISKKNKQIMRKLIGIPNATKVLLYSGRLEPRKNVSLLLTLFKQYLANKRFFLILAYNKPQTTTEIMYHQKILRIVNKNKLNKDCMLIEDAYSKFLPASLYGTADCVISFSDTEVSPLVEIEASACHVQFFNPFIKDKTLSARVSAWESISLEIENILRDSIKSFKDFNNCRKQ